MNSEAIKIILQPAQSTFLQKKIEDSLQLTQQALDVAKTKNAPTEIIQAQIFLGKILTTKGRYKGDSECFEKALTLLQNIENQSLNYPESIDHALAICETYRMISDWESAKDFSKKALEESEHKNDTHRLIQALQAESEIYILKNQFGDALDLAKQALEKLKGLDDDSLKAEVYNLICKIYINRQEYDQILKFAEEVLSISKASGDVEKEIIASSYLAVYYGSQLDYKTSIQYFYDSLEQSESIGFDRQTARNLINIGTIYARLFNQKEALTKYESAVEKYDRVLANRTKTILFNNIGKIYFEEKEYDKSVLYFEKTLDLAVEIKYTEMVALALVHLGKINCELQKFKEAEGFADRASEILEDLGDVNAKCINFLNYGKLAHHSGDFATAIRHLKAGIEISQKVKNEDVEIECLKFLSEVFAAQEDFENAFDFKKLYAKKQAEYLRKQRNRQVLDAEIKFATKEKQQQIDALQKENQLQAMLLEKQEEIERANEQLTQANEELKQFAYVASHDLKEPLRMIGSFTQLIHKKYAQEADEKTQTYFEYVTDGVDRMNGLLDGLLRYATVGRGSIQLKPVDLNDMLTVVQSNLRLLIEETNTQIVIDDLPTIQGISSLVSQLFQNLISNAIKFRGKDVTPQIRITSEIREKDYLIGVSDNGIGIKPEYKERIFVIFQRLHARTEYEGTGIGLAICHKIVQRLGGKIWVESEFGEGSTFYFTFPRS